MHGLIALNASAGTTERRGGSFKSQHRSIPSRGRSPEIARATGTSQRTRGTHIHERIKTGTQQRVHPGARRTGRVRTVPRGRRADSDRAGC